MALGIESRILVLGSSDLVRGLESATQREVWEEVEAALDEEQRQMNMQEIDFANGDML